MNELMKLIFRIDDYGRTIDPKRDLLPVLYKLDPHVFCRESIDLLVETVSRRDPDLFIDIAEGLLRAPIDSLKHYIDAIERCNPDWIHDHADILEDILFGEINREDWR